MRRDPTGGLVYSTDVGSTCPVCRQAVAACRCRDTPAPAQGDGILRVQRQTQGRGGKTVTVVRGVALDTAAFAALGKRLRSACGAGGTNKEGVLEVQGDHCERVIELLRAEGYTVKRAGG